MEHTYSHIDLDERRRIARWRAAGLSVEVIAEKLGRHRSTIYREIKRNTFRDRALPDYDGYYSTVAGRLLADGLSLVRICAETIYRFIYGKEDYGLCLYRYLPEARRKRRPRGSRKPRNSVFPASYRISQRPDFIGDGSQFGHWEGDLLIFERALGHANVTSLVERKSRHTEMIKNPSRHSRPIMDKIIETFSPLPSLARQSFTFDRGTEFAGFRALEDGIGARS